MRMLVRAVSTATDLRGHVVALADDGVQWGALEGPPNFWFVDIAAGIPLVKQDAEFLTELFITQPGTDAIDNGRLWDWSPLFDLPGPTTARLNAGEVFVITSATNSPATISKGDPWPDPTAAITGVVGEVRQWSVVKAQLTRRDSVGNPSLEASRGTPGGSADFDI